MSLTKRDKERQLNELTLIVTGIRLFNRECGKGGEGIDDRKYRQNSVDYLLRHMILRQNAFVVYVCLIWHQNQALQFLARFYKLINFFSASNP